jgi:translation initiation factor IF-2
MLHASDDTEPTASDLGVLAQRIPPDPARRRGKPRRDCARLRDVVTDGDRPTRGRPADDPGRMSTRGGLQCHATLSERAVSAAAQVPGACRDVVARARERRWPGPRWRTPWRTRLGAPRSQALCDQRGTPAREEGWRRERLRRHDATPRMAHRAGPSPRAWGAQTRPRRWEAARPSAPAQVPAAAAAAEGVRHAPAARAGSPRPGAPPLCGRVGPGASRRGRPGRARHGRPGAAGRRPRRPAWPARGRCGGRSARWPSGGRPRPAHRAHRAAGARRRGPGDPGAVGRGRTGPGPGGGGRSARRDGGDRGGRAGPEGPRGAGRRGRRAPATGAGGAGHGWPRGGGAGGPAGRVDLAPRATARAQDAHGPHHRRAGGLGPAPGSGGSPARPVPALAGPEDGTPRAQAG